MELIEESDLSSESEDEIKIKIPIRQDIKIPEEFSVDNLLKERQNNPIIPRSYSFHENSILSAEKLLTYNKKDSAFVPPIQLNNFYSKDGCIFNSINNQFPFFIFEILNIDEKKEESIFLSYKNELPDYMFKCIQNYPDLIQPSLEIYLSYAHYIALNNIFDSNNVLFKFAQTLPPSSIDYILWHNFLIYSIKHSFNAVFSIFNLCNFYLFKFDSQEQADNARIEIFLLFFAMICTTDIIQHKNFILIIHQMRSCLIDADFDLSQINFIVKIMCDMFSKIPIEMISSFVSFYPIDGQGAFLIHNFSIKMIFRFFELEFSEDDESLNIENLANKIYQVRFLCNSDDDEDLKKASAVVALVERAVVSALHFSTVPNEIINQIIHSLQFSIKKTDLGLLTNLKEQIHFTRSQLETISQQTFSDPIQSSIFHENESI